MEAETLATNAADSVLGTIVNELRVVALKKGSLAERSVAMDEILSRAAAYVAAHSGHSRADMADLCEEDDEWIKAWESPKVSQDQLREAVRKVAPAWSDAGVALDGDKVTFKVAVPRSPFRRRT